MSRKMIKRMIYLLVLCGLVTWIFFGLGDRILYGKSTTQMLIPAVLIFFGIPFSLYQFLRTFAITRSVLLTTVVPLSILVLGPGFGLWANYVSENDLEEYGEWTSGTVIRKEWSSQRPRGWLITGEFAFRNKKYQTFSRLEDGKIYRIGDPVQVHFSTRNPENNELITD